MVMDFLPASRNRFAVSFPDSRPMVRLSDWTLVIPVPGTEVSMYVTGIWEAIWVIICF